MVRGKRKSQFTKTDYGILFPFTRRYLRFLFFPLSFSVVACRHTVHNVMRHTHNTNTVSIDVVLFKLIGKKDTTGLKTVIVGAEKANQFRYTYK